MADKNTESPQPSPLNSKEQFKLSNWKIKYDLKNAGFNDEQIIDLTRVKAGVINKNPKYDEQIAQDVNLTAAEEKKLQNIISDPLTDKDKAALRQFKKIHKAKSALEESTTRALEEMGYSPEEAWSAQYRLRKEGFDQKAILQKAKDEIEARKQLEKEKPIRSDLVFKEVV